MAVYFCCTILGVTSTGRYPAFCPVKPGLSSPAKSSRDYLSYLISTVNYITYRKKIKRLQSRHLIFSDMLTRKSLRNEVAHMRSIWIFESLSGRYQAAAKQTFDFLRYVNEKIASQRSCAYAQHMDFRVSFRKISSGCEADRHLISWLRSRQTLNFTAAKQISFSNLKTASSDKLSAN